MIQPIQAINKIEKTDLSIFKIFEDMQDELKEVELKIQAHYQGHSLDHGHILEGGIF